MWLIKNGMPADLAFALDPHESMAAAVVFREMETGESYDWETGDWLERRR